MNKAFLREPEDTGQRHCPRCGSLGVAATRTAVEALLRPEAAAELAEAAFFCPFPRCEVAYFDLFERTATTDALVRPVYPKDSAAPLCPCFGLTCEDVEADAAESVPRRIRELLARSKGPDARCATLSPTGQCCLPEVQRYYFKLRGGAT
jgi:hypothetical protein